MRNVFSRRTDFWAHVIADILLRIGFFGVTFVLFLGSVPRRLHRHWDREEFPDYMYGVLAGATLAAVFGPWLYRTATHRGRGTLEQVKKESKSTKDEG